MAEASARRESSAQIASQRTWGWLAAFGVTLFLSALLLFTIQPLFAKMVLPRLGGAASVWSIAMVFFQAMLLAGYAYAHLVVRFAGRFGLIAHIAVMGVAFLWLPVAVAEGFGTPPNSNLPFWVLALFAASVGVPFFAVAANAPLLQAWFARTGEPRARDPYFLYGASNIGSFAALLAYPVLIEPLLTLAAQSRLWSIGYAVLMGAVLICGAASTLRWGKAEGAVKADLTSATVRSSGAQRLQWIGLAFLPSALLIAVTAHLSTNIAAAPFLWVLPLAVFLLSFVVAFTENPLIPARSVQLMLPVLVPAAMATVAVSGTFGGLWGIAINLFALFVVAVAWHSALYARRPDAAQLTEFYLFMSVGGVLGGAFTSLVAPAVFDSVAEFPLLLIASLIVVPEMRALVFRRRLLGLTVAGVGALVFAAIGFADKAELRERNFFGVLSTEISGTREFRVLMHGTTVHGAERLADFDLPPPMRPTPLTYYAEDGPLAQGIRMARVAKPGGTLSVGIVGLGTGSLACYSEPSDRWRFFEIDPDVARIARDRRYFNFLSRCAPDAQILAGDARLTLEREANGAFDVLVIDAFSSDAIPVHLLTGEALSLYARKVASDGVVLLHVSNRYLELLSVVAATAKAEGLSGASLIHLRSDEDFTQRLLSSSAVAAIARDPSTLDPFSAAGWKPLVADSSVAGWTDDYSNILGAMLRMQGFLPVPKP